MFLNYYKKKRWFLMLWTNSRMASKQEYRREGGKEKTNYS